MEPLKRKWRDLSLRSFFLTSVCMTVGIAAALSAILIWGCVSFRNWLVPDSNAAYLTLEEEREDGTAVTQTILMEYGAELKSFPGIQIVEDGVPVPETVKEQKYGLVRIENTWEALTPKRKLAYRICGIAMIAGPALFAFAGIFFCGLFFYRYKLKYPLELLQGAADRIAGQDLDFEISYDRGDEMGGLCRSFEAMRSALEKNYKAMWEMLEERRLLQASVAHDLRNPIAIIQGYTEYLGDGLEKGEMSREKLGRIVKNLGMAAKRLESYTESVRMLNRSEEIVPDRRPVRIRKWAEDVTKDLRVWAGRRGICLRAGELPENRELRMDCDLAFRILENVVSNALRFAKQRIDIDFSLSEDCLSISVTDDGGGFMPEILHLFAKKGRSILPPGEDGHLGIGLAVSRMLAEKHGGSLTLSNGLSGACVIINLCLT